MIYGILLATPMSGGTANPRPDTPGTVIMQTSPSVLVADQSLEPGSVYRDSESPPQKLQGFPAPSVGDQTPSESANHRCRGPVPCKTRGFHSRCDAESRQKRDGSRRHVLNQRPWRRGSCRQNCLGPAHQRDFHGKVPEGLPRIVASAPSGSA